MGSEMCIRDRGLGGSLPDRRCTDKHAARATARVERTAPDSKDTATFLRRARAASLKAIGSKFGALAEEEYDKIAPVIACTLPALTDSIPERKRKELAGEVTRELQVVGNAASIAIGTWVRSNDKFKASSTTTFAKLLRKFLIYVLNMSGKGRLVRKFRHFLRNFGIFWRFLQNVA